MIDENEHIQRLLAQAEGPLRQLAEQRRTIEHLGPQFHALEAARLGPEHLALELSRAKLDASLRYRLDQLSSEMAFVSDARVAAALSVVDRHVAEACESVLPFRAQALLPVPHHLASLAQQLAARVTSLDTTSAERDVWSRRLESQMAAVTSPWIDAAAPALSFEGFAIASRLGELARSPSPFSDSAREEVDEHLGASVRIEDDASPEERDEAQVEAGMSVSLLAIVPSATNEVLVQCGFGLASRFAPIPATTDDSHPGLVFQPANFGLVTFVEQHLRQFICRRMREQYGDRWIRQKVNPALVEDWERRREQALANDETPLELIQYSNFMDMKDIVVRKDHWREVFEQVFVRKTHFEVAMERLHWIRLPLAHARPIGTAQQYALVAESHNVLGALGIDLFNPI